MLGQLFIFLFFITPSHSCLHSAEEVENSAHGTPSVIHIPNGEPFFVRCPIMRPSKISYNITWYKNGTETEISTDTQGRILQDHNYLKFLPAKLEDSGFYSCLLQNEKGCVKSVLGVEVFQNDNGICYQNGALYNYTPVLDPALTIVCPYVTELVDTVSAQFHWFKECKPLDLTTDRDKYLINKNELSILKTTLQDGGVYTCVTSFIRNGTNYNISRSINYTIFPRPLVSNPVVIRYPTDNFVDAELGTLVTVTCQTLLHGVNDLFWTYNDSFIDEYSEDGRVKDGETYDSVTNDGHKEKLKCQNLTFSSVKKEDYGLKFYCTARSSTDHSKAFFILKQPDPNFQGFLIAFFVTAVFFIITSIIAIKVFKVDLVLWYRSSCFFRPQQNDGKLYDAYIMFPRNSTGNCAHDIDLFVLKLLPEVLEKQCAYRLFIIGRDDLPGQAIADLVDKAISQSRRLIIVLGQIFNRINLGEDFEQKIAMYDALIRNEIKVILIEMEQITDFTFMPESIKYIRQKQGVVRWKDPFTEASLSPNTRFWKNIRYRMPPSPRHSDKDLDYICTEDL